MWFTFAYFNNLTLLFKKSFTVTSDNSVISHCKIDRHHCHFRAVILHQQKLHNSKKKKVNWHEQCFVSFVALSVTNLLCPDKRSMVCGTAEELAGDPSPSPRWEVLPTSLICCLKIVIRSGCALQTIRRLAFLFSTKLKDPLRSWNLPQAILFEKNGAIMSLVIIRCMFVLRACLKSARWISLELH